MKPQAALVRADSTVELDSESTVDVEVSIIVVPRHAKLDYPLCFDDGFDHWEVFRMSLYYRN